MKAVILCAGLGTRLRPLTHYICKAMVPVAGKPTLERIIEQLKQHGFADYLVALSLFPEQCLNYFKDGSPMGVRVTWSVHPEPQGTSGELCLMASHLENEEDFLVHYGDILSDIDVSAMIRMHQERRAMATLALITSFRLPTGVVRMDADGRVTYFEEKPVYPEPCNAAILVLSRRAMDYMHPGEDISTNAIPAMIQAGETVIGFIAKGAYWHDIGQLSTLDKASEEFARREAQQGIANSQERIT